MEAMGGGGVSFDDTLSCQATQGTVVNQSTRRGVA